MKSCSIISGKSTLNLRELIPDYEFVRSIQGNFWAWPDNITYCEIDGSFFLKGDLLLFNYSNHLCRRTSKIEGKSMAMFFSETTSSCEFQVFHRGEKEHVFTVAGVDGINREAIVDSIIWSTFKTEGIELPDNSLRELIFLA